MNRRQWLIAAAASLGGMATFGKIAAWGAMKTAPRVRPGDTGWPSAEAWDRLNQQVGGRLIEVNSPLRHLSDTTARETLAANLRNPYFIGDEPGLTQTLGWTDAWVSQPSIYAVAAETADDVAAAVNFARQNNLRLVVKGGGHSYQGTSNAPDSLLVWTRGMKDIVLHDGFVASGCDDEPVAAATVGAGVLWGQAYAEIAERAGRYVQGGGCMTVGVAGLIQSGGFGPFSKGFGMAAASLLEAEIVTADGAVRRVNACRDPELFWALKGGGGGTFGVVTSVTLRTHDFPNFFGGVFATVKATSAEAFHRLVSRVIAFYAEALFNPHWGEQLILRPDHELQIAMVFQGLDRDQAARIWQPLFDWIAAAPQGFSLADDPAILALPAREFWNPETLKQVPGLVQADDRPGAPAGNIFWSSNVEEAGQVLHAYQSTWLPASLLAGDRQTVLADALVAAARHWSVSLHLNKGLAGAPAQAIEAARDTATNPAALDAFALAISAADAPPAYPGIPGFEPDVEAGRNQAQAVSRATQQLRRLMPEPGSYVSESDYFEADWQRAFWGANYPRLLAAKQTYDPEGLFFAHHGVGSEGWSPDGFSRR